VIEESLTLFAQGRVEQSQREVDEKEEGLAEALDCRI
jgi:hypothetical protein